ncbi:Pol protein [Pyrenophora tritici-repentis]|uniref:Pol protein n=1 Tax=Pyrenophora tritici-repentis TaxID=45151 RepID=A0A922N4T4_9PLEO|nr:Pol protein [Pyrenophora tritici-repentis]
MASVETQRSTKTVVILTKPEDWSLWLFQHKDKAVSHGVWEYCNPAVSTPPTLTPKPERPILPDGDLTAEVLQVQRMKLSEWEWKYKEWHQKDKALKEICTDVASTISTSLIPLIQNDATAHARLAKLRAHIVPSDPTRRRELRVKYDALRSPKPRNTSVDKWLDEWICVTDLMAMLDMPEMKGGQATAELRKLLDLQENPAVKELDLPTINTLVASFRQFLRIIKPQGSTFGTFGASLGIADSSGSTKANTTEEGPSQNQKPQAKHNHPPGKCICLEEHWYSNCPYINPAVRRAGWTLDPEIEAKFKKTKKNPRIAKQLQRAAERQNAKATSEPTTTPIAFDAQAHGDHQPHSMACSFQAFSTNHVSNPPYINRWIMDPGSNVHVINSKSWRWTHTRYSTADEALYAGSQSVSISEWGNVIIPVRTPNGIQDIQLTHVALVEGFFANILSLSRCKDMKIHFDSGKNHLYQATPNNVVTLLDYHAGHWLIDADDGKRPNANSLQSMAAFRPSHDPKPHLKATATEAHHIWAHPGPDTIRHLEAAVRGFKLQGSDPPQSWKECEDCILTKMNKQISRRTPDTVSTRPFERIAIDLVYLVPQGEECYNGDKYALHAVCQFSKWHEISCLPNRLKTTLIPAVFNLIEKIQRQLGYKYVVIIIRSDNEKGLGRDFAAACKSIGIKIETTAENTDEQKGLQEAAGRTIMQRTRALRISSGLPKDLTNELAVAAVQLLNTTPVHSLGWKTPHEVVFNTKPSVAHYSPIGCRAYVYRRDIKAADKTEPRAHIGYLVGYDSSNIYRVWIPTLDRVIRTRDVIFKWQFSYKDDKLNNITTNKITEQEVETLDLEQPHFTATAKDLYTTEQLDQHLEEIEISAAYSDRSPMDLTKGTMSPSRSPSPTNSTIAVLQRPTPSMESRHAYDIPGYLPDRHNNNAPQALHPDIGDHNVITGSRRSRAKKGQDRVSSNFFTYYGTFATSLHPTLYEKITAITPKTRLHRDQMPEPPKRFKDVVSHPQADLYWNAMKKEIDDCWKKGCFENTKVTPFTADAETLPLMWVYTNKFDEDGYFLKAKARLVVRGDLQTQWGDTYAATLAAKTFRALIAMSTKFGLLMFQYDAMNAFLNARVPRKLYCNTPEGFTTQFGALLLLRRALYGLKEAPLLWYQDLANTLQDLGLKQIPNTPCLFANNSLIVFFYVDDIVVLVHPSKLDIHKEFQDKLFKKYELRSMGQLNWFLGIRVVRDISQQSTWLIQDAFIDKVAHKYNLMEGATTLPDFPMAETNLEPNTVVDKALKKRYQQLVGSLAYISVFTRPDISLTHSILSRYLNNPGEQHLRAAIHAWRFLVKTRNFALKASALTPDNTDASFADDLSTRRSSDGYLFKLFGMPIDWKATKQRSVTKSTTEAELYALSRAASEFIWWNNLFDQLNFKTDITPVIYCDNKQTVGIVTKAAERLQTKLKHVDIHQLWLRQAVERGEVNVQWISTAQMPADGLTKALPKQKHVNFTRQLGLEDITKRLLSLHNN